MNKHTPGPWQAMLLPEDTQGVLGHRFWIRAESGAEDGNMCISDISLRDSDMANARRIVACVNACEGINPEAVPDLLTVLRAAVARVELANRVGDPILSAWLPDAQAAIAKAEGR